MTRTKITLSYKLTTHYQLRSKICTVCGQCPSDATLQPLGSSQSEDINFASNPLKGIMHLYDFSIAIYGGKWLHIPFHLKV